MQVIDPGVALNSTLVSRGDNGVGVRLLPESGELSAEGGEARGVGALVMPRGS